MLEVTVVIHHDNIGHIRDAQIHYHSQFSLVTKLAPAAISNKRPILQLPACLLILASMPLAPF